MAELVDEVLARLGLHETEGHEEEEEAYEEQSQLL